MEQCLAPEMFFPKKYRVLARDIRARDIKRDRCPQNGPNLFEFFIRGNSSTVDRKFTLNSKIEIQRIQYKGCTKKYVLAQNLKVVFSQEPFVLGGCHFHSL